MNLNFIFLPNKVSPRRLRFSLKCAEKSQYWLASSFGKCSSHFKKIHLYQPSTPNEHQRDDQWWNRKSKREQCKSLLSTSSTIHSINNYNYNTISSIDVHDYLVGNANTHHSMTNSNATHNHQQNDEFHIKSQLSGSKLKKWKWMNFFILNCRIKFEILSFFYSSIFYFKLFIYI